LIKQIKLAIFLNRDEAMTGEVFMCLHSQILMLSPWKK